jgi:hypothetical protein
MFDCPLVWGQGDVLAVITGSLDLLRFLQSDNSEILAGPLFKYSFRAIKL